MKKPLIITIGCLAVIAVGGATVYAASVLNAPAETTVPAPTPSYYAETAGKPGTMQFTLTIAKNTIESGPKVVTVKQNDAVQMTINGGKGQEDIEVSVDGYELNLVTAMNATGAFEFNATKKGSFPIRVAGNEVGIFIVK
ncbi:MAG TPA: hypothetical protein VF597_02250 [Candidatus Saccharimonadales bacterium]|jgi:hypothetical protein